MKKPFIFLCLAASLLLSCEKECEKDKTGTIIFVNTSDSYGVTVFLPNDPFKIVIAPSGKFDYTFELCPPGFQCDDEVQFGFGYQWSDQEYKQNVWAFPSLCGTDRVELVR